MPCLNEAKTLPPCIRKALAAFAAHGISGEVVVADNGSTDGSPEIAAGLGARVVHVSERGYGAALMAGIASARGSFVVMGDADDSYDFGAIEPFVEKLRAGADLVMGCRMPRGGGTIHPGAMPIHHRWVGNPLLSAAGRLFFGAAVTDFHCGLRGFRKEAIDGLALRTTGMEFASEMVVKATLNGLRIEEVPITLHKDGRDRRPHLRSFRDGWRHLRFLLLFSPRWLFLLPGAVLLLLGLVGGGVLQAGPLHVGPVVFDVSSLFVCAMSVLVGFQLCVYAVFTRAFAVGEGLMPADPLLEKLARLGKLETGIAIGALCGVLGLVRLLWAVFYWGYHGFGALPYAETLRLVIPGGTAVVLGIQVIFSSFFLSVLGLARK
jgi:hypothetical protein